MHKHVSQNDKGHGRGTTAALEVVPLSGVPLLVLKDSGRNSTRLDVRVNTPADLHRQSRAVCRSGSSQSLTKLLKGECACGELDQERTWYSEPPKAADPAGDRSGKTNRSKVSEKLAGGRLIHDTDTGCIADQTSDRVLSKEGGGLAE